MVIKDKDAFLRHIEKRLIIYKALRDAFLEVPSLNDAKRIASELNLSCQLCYDDIKQDYIKLFIGPYKLPSPPYESVYRSSDHLIMQDATLNVRDCYRKWVLKVRMKGPYPDDHIGIEFEFMAFLLGSAYEAILSGNEPDKVLAAQEKFLSEHILKWVPRFCDDICSSASTNFFRQIAIFIKRFLEDEANYLQRNQCLVKYEEA